MLNAMRLSRLLRYALVGAVGTLVQYAFLVGAVSTQLATPVAASMVGAIFGAIVNYLLNAKYTYRHTGHGKALPKFALVAIAGALMNGALMKVMVDMLGLNYLIAQVLATLTVLGVTYTVNSLWTFRPAAPPPVADNP